MTNTDTTPQSIREYLTAYPIGSRTMRELCEKHSIDLDSPWPPHFPKSADRAEPEPAKATGQLVLFPKWADTRRA